MRCFTTVCLLYAAAGTGYADDTFVITQVTDGLYRGTSPSKLSDFAKLRQLGIRTIIDTRAYRPLASAHEAELAARHGLQYRHTRYPAMPWSMAVVEEIYPMILREEDYPILVHCNIGVDRTGLVFALYRVRAQHWAPEDAYEEMAKNGMQKFLWYFADYFWHNAYGPGKPAKRPAASSASEAAARPARGARQPEPKPQPTSSADAAKLR